MKHNSTITAHLFFQFESIEFALPRAIPLIGGKRGSYPRRAMERRIGMRKILRIALAATTLCVGASAFAASYTAATTASVTTTIIRPISLSKNSDLKFGAI